MRRQDDVLGQPEARVDHRHVLREQRLRGGAVGWLVADLRAVAHRGRSAMIATSSASCRRPRHRPRVGELDERLRAQRGGVLGDERADARLAEQLAVAARLGQPVGAREQQLAGTERELAMLERGGVLDAERQPRRRQLERRVRSAPTTSGGTWPALA